MQQKHYSRLDMQIRLLQCSILFNIKITSIQATLNTTNSCAKCWRLVNNVENLYAY